MESTLRELEERGHTFEEDGAIWLRSTGFGDEKDRVVWRSNGATTYFASDVAYHLHKFERGYDLVVDLWGADHHGYVPRLLAAAQALGIAEASLAAAIEYAETREQFKQPIASFQAIQNKIANMAVRIEASRALTYRAAWLKDLGKPYGYEAAQAKLFAAETAAMASTTAIQIHGGYGYCQDYPVERYYRDAKITELYEGTSEIHRLVLARALLSPEARAWETDR